MRTHTLYLYLTQVWELEPFVAHELANQGEAAALAYLMSLETDSDEV